MRVVGFYEIIIFIIIALSSLIISIRLLIYSLNLLDKKHQIEKEKNQIEMEKIPSNERLYRWKDISDMLEKRISNAENMPGRARSSERSVKMG